MNIFNLIIFNLIALSLSLGTLYNFLHIAKWKCAKLVVLFSISLITCEVEHLLAFKFLLACHNSVELVYLFSDILSSP